MVIDPEQIYLYLRKEENCKMWFFVFVAQIWMIITVV